MIVKTTSPKILKSIHYNYSKIIIKTIKKTVIKSIIQIRKNKTLHTREMQFIAKNMLLQRARTEYAAFP